jgi:3-oxoacyl-[acyl-carrier protein] reductase
MDLELEDARVLVTAASQGLGAATARRFSMEGAKVVINARSREKLQRTAEAIRTETGNPIFALASDVTNPVATKQLRQESAENSAAD